MLAQVVHPDDWSPAKGYSNGIVLSGTRVLFIAGQVGWDAGQRIVAGGFTVQFEQALMNVRAVAEAAGGTVAHIGRLTIYVTDKTLYTGNLKPIGAAYRAVFGRHFPAMSLVEVKGLLEPGALVEIEATAVLP